MYIYIYIYIYVCMYIYIYMYIGSPNNSRPRDTRRASSCCVKWEAHMYSRFSDRFPKFKSRV